MTPIAWPWDEQKPEAEKEGEMGQELGHARFTGDTMSFPREMGQDIEMNEPFEEAAGLRFCHGGPSLSAAESADCGQQQNCPCGIPSP